MNPPHVRSLIPLLLAALLLPLGAVTADAAGTRQAANFEGDTVPVKDPRAGVAFYNGQDATVDEFPAIIAGLREGGTRPQGQSCTGSVIAPRKVLIAAHCADAQGRKTFLYGLDDLNATGGFRTEVVEYKKHPRYVNFDQGYDVAVVTVADDIPVPGGRYATFATSADAGLEAPGRNGLGFGYGKKDVDDASRDVTLDKATLPIVNGDQLCQGVGAGFKSATMICAGYSDGRVTILPGDSGGPFIVDGKIVGLASWSRSDFRWYSIYARLTNDMGDWVKEQIGGQQPGEFGVGVTPNDLKVAPGKYVSTTVTTTTSGAPENVDLTATGLPAGTRAVFQPATVQTGQTAKLTFETAASTPTGRHQITVTATNADGESANATVTLTVGDAPTGEVKVTVNPASASVRQGFFAQPTITASGGTGNLRLTVSGLPTGTQAFVNPSSVGQGGTATALIFTGFQTPPGTYPLTVRATSADGKTGTATFTLTVTR
ncbi:trypsin-like serine protease [Nonomuraea antri]|uniref:trypsin-like serine protease n=1 Tax=Nonomuraea antri TaxID=2730852 RepID=UPI001C2B9AC8|nr:trypsin-like serine protease [Nonomuraea antri]